METTANLVDRCVTLPRSETHALTPDEANMYAEAYEKSARARRKRIEAIEAERIACEAENDAVEAEERCKAMEASSSAERTRATHRPV